MPLSRAAGLLGPAVHRPRHARPVRAGLPDRARSAGRAPGRRARRCCQRLHPHAGHLARHPDRRTATAATAWPMASWSRPRTTHPKTAASSTTRPTAGRPIRTSPAGSRTRPIACWPMAGPTIRRADAQPTPYDYVSAYVDDLPSVVDLDVVRASGVKIGVDPLGGASVAYWLAIAERYGLNLSVVNESVDPRFGFMTVDWDGKIRMDPSSPYAMAGLIRLRDQLRPGPGQRRRCRPPRHRHPRRGLAESEPLPLGGHLLPVRASRALVGRRVDRQDAGQQLR